MQDQRQIFQTNQSDLTALPAEVNTAEEERLGFPVNSPLRFLCTHNVHIHSIPDFRENATRHSLAIVVKYIPRPIHWLDANLSHR